MSKRVLRCILFAVTLHMHAMLVAQVLAAPELVHCTNSDSTVHVRRLYDDSLCTSFLICIPRNVAPHYHRHHTEHVMVLEGAGIMQLGDSVFSISTGTSIVIPMGTPHSVRTTSSDPLRVISVQSPRFDGADRILVKP